MSSAPSSTSSGRQASRFSTLNVFKMSTSTSSSRPPPPPPKDPYYVSTQPNINANMNMPMANANHSLASLAQSLTPEMQRRTTEPMTPVSVSGRYGYGYAASARSPSPSPSYTPSYTPSYAPSERMNQSTTSLSTASMVSGSSSVRREKEKGKGFFRALGMGRKRSKAKMQTMQEQEQSLRERQSTSTTGGRDAYGEGDDASISLPWNFQVRGPCVWLRSASSLTSSYVCKHLQHNVHVDETYVPPLVVLHIDTRAHESSALALATTHRQLLSLLFS